MVEIRVGMYGFKWDDNVEDADYIHKWINPFVRAFIKDDLETFLNFLSFGKKYFDINIEDLITDANEVVKDKFKIGAYLMSLK